MAGVSTKSKGNSARKAVAILVIVLAVCLGSFALYLNYTLNAATKTVNSANYIAYNPGNPSVNATLILQKLLIYGNGTSLIPYSLFSYSARNASSVAVNVTVFKSKPPSGVFVLNTSEECFNCGSTDLIIGSLTNNLMRYGVIKNQSGLSIAQLSSVPALPNDSIVVILSGLLPSELLTPGVRNLTPMQIMMNKGISVIYVGQDFSHELLPGSIVIPTPGSSLPRFMQTFGGTANSTKGFFFNKSTFSFVTGSSMCAITYTQALNGSIIAFSNIPGAWPSYADVGTDIASAIHQLFWLPRYSTGYATTTTASLQNTSDRIGVIRSATNIPNETALYQTVLRMNAGYARAVISASSAYNSNVAYQYLYFSPHLSLNGTISIAPSIVTNQQVPVVMTLFTHSTTPLQIQPHLSAYTMAMDNVTTIPLPFFTASNNFTFVKYLSFYLAPGNYILELDSFTNLQYAATYLHVLPININLVSSNFTSGIFTFSVTSAGQRLSGISYNITLNKLYERSGILRNGTLTYALPTGTPVIYGDLNFSIDMLSQRFSTEASNAPNVITVNKQYVELVIVSIVVILMVVLVRAPNRDEFYIDVPSLPEQKKIDIKLKEKEVLLAFDRLNMHYHWKYMPLSSAELKIAISGNIRYNNMPVNLTYNNVESLINQLVVRGSLTGADDLYAPKAWLEQSGHDIEYLVTFKKLRLYLVTHAYLFTDMDTSSVADIVATLHNERRYIIIHSKQMKFGNIPIYSGSKTCIAFMNSEKLEEFKSKLYKSMTQESEMLKVYLSSGIINLMDADNPSESMD